MGGQAVVAGRFQQGLRTRIIHWYPKFLGGGGVAKAVAALASAQARLGHDVAVAGIETHAPSAAELDPEVALMRWEPRWRSTIARVCAPAFSVRDADMLRNFSPDIVHAHGEMNPDNVIAAKLFDCALVLSPHGGFHPEVFKRGFTIAKKCYFQLARLRLYRHATIHAVSPIEARCISALLPQQAVYCVHQGPGHQVQPAKPQVRRQSADTTSFIFVGRLNTREKGLDILLDAFAAAVRQAPGMDAMLTLVGPDYRDSLRGLKQRCETLGIAKRVFFAGACDGAEIDQLLRDADIYIQLSRLEGFGLSVAEALLSGLPAILSNAIGAVSFRELYDLPHVRLVEPDAAQATEAMLAFMPRHAYLRKIAAAHVKRIQAFLSWDNAAKLHEQEYEKLLIARPEARLRAFGRPVAALPR